MKKTLFTFLFLTVFFNNKNDKNRINSPQLFYKRGVITIDSDTFKYAEAIVFKMNVLL